jgi:hypothetical protein
MSAIGRVDQLVVCGRQREAPQLVVAGFARGEQMRAAKRIVVREDAAIFMPSEMTIAPVSVARSTIVLGLFALDPGDRVAEHEPPSASVLMTSTVCPDMV